MKKIFFILFTIIFSLPNLTIAKEQVDIECLSPELLITATDHDQEKLVRALDAVIPNVYGNKLEYKEWKIEALKPMQKLKGENKVYYEMAKNFCGEKVAKQSWFVRLRFPKLLPAQSASLGELFIVQDKQQRWSVWFRYH